MIVYAQTIIGPFYRLYIDYHRELSQSYAQTIIGIYRGPCIVYAQAIIAKIASTISLYRVLQAPMIVYAYPMIGTFHSLYIDYHRELSQSMHSLSQGAIIGYVQPMPRLSQRRQHLYQVYIWNYRNLSLTMHSLSQVPL